MKPFSLEEFKAGKLAVDNDGDTYRFIAHVTDACPTSQLVVLHTGSGHALTRTVSGAIFSHGASSGDLVGVVPEKVKSIGYRRYTYRASSGKLRTGILEEDQDYSPQLKDNFVDWIDYKWQYWEVEL